jgi:hypothetical protein
MSADEKPISLEEKKLELDAEIRRRETTVKEMEAKRSGGLTTAQASIAGALLALVSGIVGAGITAWSTQTVESGKSLTSLQLKELEINGTLQLEKSKQDATEALERKRFETSLILEAIKAPRDDAIRNLRFFVAAGFVSDPDGRIANLSDDRLPSIGQQVDPKKVAALRECMKAQGVTDTPVTFFLFGQEFAAQRLKCKKFLNLE